MFAKDVFGVAGVFAELAAELGHGAPYRLRVALGNPLDVCSAGVLDPGAQPLAGLVGDRGSVEGLRLLGGDLVLKIEVAGATVQILLRGAGRFPEDGGIVIRHPFGLRIPQSVQRLLDFWSVAGRPAPWNGRDRGMGFGRSTGW